MMMSKYTHILITKKYDKIIELILQREKDLEKEKFVIRFKNKKEFIEWLVRFYLINENDEKLKKSVEGVFLE